MKKILSILVCSILFVSSCTKGDENNEGPSEVQINESISSFSFKSLKALSKEEENTLFSPLSLHTALTMTTMGASTHSLDNLRSFLDLDNWSKEDISESYKILLEKFDLSNNDTTSLNCKNQFFYDVSRISLYQEFSDLVKNGFDHGELILDFNDPDAINKVNQWAAESTNDRIKEIIKEIEDTEILFIVNATYFIGDWSLGFHPDQTIDDIFYGPGEVEYDVKMMSSDEIRMSYADSKFSAVDLPFKGKEYAMTFIVPQNTPHQFISLEESLNSWYTDLLDNKLTEQRTYVRLPRFELATKYKLNDVFKEMGLTEIWKGKADFSSLGTSPLGPLYVSRILHDAFIKVDEKGVEGAAVTVVGIAADSAPPQIIFNKPFFFVIRHVETQTPIFVGVFNTPE